MIFKRECGHFRDAEFVVAYFTDKYSRFFRLLRIESGNQQQRHHQTKAVLHTAGAVLADKPAEVRVDDDDAHGGDKKQTRRAPTHPFAKNHQRACGDFVDGNHPDNDERKRPTFRGEILRESGYVAVGKQTHQCMCHKKYGQRNSQDHECVLRFDEGKTG
jgi:hypothetical protein